MGARAGTTRHGPLRPGELAEAVVLADVSLALTVVGQVVPFGGALLAAAVVPMAVVGARHRLRAVIAGAVAAGGVGFLVVGSAALTSMAACGALGALVGAGDRRGWTRRRTMGTGLAVLWPPTAVLVDVALLLFSDLRRLTLDNIRNGWRGLFHILENLGLSRIAAAGDRAVEWVVRNWWLSIPIALFFALWFGIWLAHGLATPALRRVRRAFGPPPAARDDRDDRDDRDEGAAAPEPLPVELHSACFRYPNAGADALHDVSLDVRAHEMLAVVGPNGSGKSTLARLVAGRRAPTSGRVDRPGAVGLGRPGGTAMVFQRPEAQVLGVRVRDDVVWGLPPADRDAIDVDAVLDRVGLRAFADRETSTLSGGELQRLAIAAATARGPALFVSDEATAMVDAGGRARLVALLRSLADAGIGVVHVTHHANEAQLADRVVTLAAGRVVDTPLSVHPNGAVPAAPRPGNAVIALRDVGHVYSRRTPWAHRALIDVTLTIREHEAVLVVGHNGSGKSTLAWVLAGLLDPSEGRAELDGRPITEQVGRVGLSFQHARLQLLRPTVLDEVRAAASVDDEAAAAALAAVGLDAAILGSARVDELSGGQMRRVVLAGVLAAEPRVIVLDEPFAGLDAHGRAELRAVLARLRAERGVALVVVSHDPDLSPHDFDRVVELVAGRIVRDEPAGDVVTELQP